MSAARPRILWVKLSDFGDALLTTPALARLRAALPEARIEVLTTRIGALAYRHCGLVDEVLTFDKQVYDQPGGLLARPGAPLALGRRLRARRYEALGLAHGLTTRFGALKHAALCLSTGAPVRAGVRRPGSPRGAFLSHWRPDLGFDGQHVVEMGEAVCAALLEGLGRPSPELPAVVGEPGSTASLDPARARHLHFDPGAAARGQAAALLAPLAAAAPSPWVALHPGSGGFSRARRWPPERFAALADALMGRGARVILVGRPEDGLDRLRAAMRGRPSLDLGGRTDLPTLAAVLERCDLLVGNDSGVTHLATAMGLPVVAVFGPSNPIAWGPWWPGQDRDGRPGPSPHRVLRLGLPCQPCFYVGHARGSPGGCPTRDCLVWLPVERVLAVVLERLASGQSGAPAGAGRP